MLGIQLITQREEKKSVKMSEAYWDKYQAAARGEKLHNMDKTFAHPEAFYNGYRRAVNKAGEQYYSDKLDAALPILKKGKTLLYTNWVDFGLEPIVSSLKKLGLTSRVFSGDVDKDTRAKIVRDFNKNKFQVLVITRAGGEGIDLKGVKSVVILDPTWNESSLQQVTGRAIRYGSHAHLPASQRNVTVYRMVGVRPKADSSGIESGDVTLYEIIANKSENAEIIVDLLKSISI
jgi:SNF2 family DNA or RNA helicase